MEPFLDPSNDRESLFPIVHKDIWQMYQIAKASFWVPEEIDLLQDMRDWETVLRDEERAFLKKVFGFLAVFDQLVIKNLEEGLTSKVTVNEVCMFYRFQEMMEDIHVHTYARFPETFIKDAEERHCVLNAIQYTPSIKAMAEWARSTSHLDFAERLVIGVIVEGVFFSSIFASFFYMKKQGKLPGLCHANELIARDEGQHRDFALLLLSKLERRPTHEFITTAVREAVVLIAAYTRECAPVSMIGMNSDLMETYIKYVADCACVDSEIRCPDGSFIRISGLLGYKIYNVVNPFPWMTMISMDGKSNMFDASVSQYSRSAVLTKQEDNMVRFDAAF